MDPPKVVDSQKKMVPKKRKKSDAALAGEMLEPEEPMKMTSTVLAERGKFEIKILFENRKHSIRFAKRTSLEKIFSAISNFCGITHNKENLISTNFHCSGPEDLRLPKGNTLELVVKAAVKELKQKQSGEMLLSIHATSSHSPPSQESLASSSKSFKAISRPASQSHDKIIRPQGLAGLYNSGNVCFAISILQSLSHCVNFRTYFETLSLDASQTGVSIALKDLLANLWSGQTDIVNPSKFLRTLETALEYSFGREDDAHWFLQALLQRLDEELASMSVGNLGTLSELFRAEKQLRSRCVECRRWSVGPPSTSLAPTVPFASDRKSVV